MFYSLRGTLVKKTAGTAVIEVAGVGYKVFVSQRTAAALPPEGREARIFTSLSVKEDALDLFGFADEPTLRFFELLCTVSGVGPKTALAVLDVDSIERLSAAILEKRADLILRAPGIGKKTAERIIVDLHSKLELEGAAALAGKMTTEVEVEEALVGLGYARHDARRSAYEGGKGGGNFEEQLKRALKALGSNQK
jgi:Holliday junction DNA helicase RuvA